jgi:hypothetical protein
LLLSTSGTLLTLGTHSPACYSRKRASSAARRRKGRQESSVWCVPLAGNFGSRDGSLETAPSTNESASPAEFAIRGDRQRRKAGVRGDTQQATAFYRVRASSAATCGVTRAGQGQLAALIGEVHRVLVRPGARPARIPVRSTAPMFPASRASSSRTSGGFRAYRGNARRWPPVSLSHVGVKNVLADQPDG